MADDKSIRIHRFQYNNGEVQLLFEIEQIGLHRQLTLLDAIGNSIEHIMSVPDETIEAEACFAASQENARYT